VRPFFRHGVGGGKRADALRDAVAPGLATFTQEAVMSHILHHLKLVSVPPPMGPSPPAPGDMRLRRRARQRGPRGAVRAAAASLAPLPL
jgi:hypothetical protein